jgi:hypothetical protein
LPPAPGPRHRPPGPRHRPPGPRPPTPDSLRGERPAEDETADDGGDREQQRPAETDDADDGEEETDYGDDTEAAGGKDETVGALLALAP